MTVPVQAIKEYLMKTDNACHAIAGVVADKFNISRDALVEAALENTLPEDADMTRPGDTLHDT